MALYTIKLTDIQIHASLGWYPEEKHLMNLFNVSLELEVWVESNLHLDGTVDYSQVAGMVKEVFSGKKSLLLEGVTDELGEMILQQFQRVEKVKVGLKKMHPLLAGKPASVTVERVFSRPQK